MADNSNTQNLFARLSRVNLSEVAAALGLQVFSSADSDQGKALCPFHSDTHPSLILYTMVMTLTYEYTHRNL